MKSKKAIQQVQFSLFEDEVKELEEIQEIHEQIREHVEWYKENAKNKKPVLTLYSRNRPNPDAENYQDWIKYIVKQGYKNSR